MDEKILRTRRKRLTALLLLLFFSSGWFSIFTTSELPHVFLSTAVSVSATLLLITISQIQNRPLLRSFHWLICSTWLFVFPIYMIRLYTWRGAGLVILAIAAALISSNAGYYLALFLVQ